MFARAPATRLLDEFAYELLTSKRDSPVDLRKLLADIENLELLAARPDADIGPFVDTARDLISAGFPQLAERVARAGRAFDPGSTWLSYLSALALARLGSSARSARLLDELIPRLVQSEKLYVEAYALRGRLSKDSAMRASDPKDRRRHFRLAAESYEHAASVGRSHFASINAASMRLLAGEPASAAGHARSARDIASREVSSGLHDFWTVATLAEAALLLGDMTASEELYLEAVSRAAGRRGDIASMNRQLRMLATCCEVPSAVSAATTVGQVVIFTGHRADPEHSKVRRLSDSALEEIANAIEAFFREVKPSVVIGSAASGVDTMVLEAASRHGCERHVWLPLDREQFIERSVRDGGPSWVERFHQVMSEATRVVTIPTETTSDDSIPFEYLKEIVLGAGLLEADRLATGLIGLAVIDPSRAARPGGSTDTVAHWRSADIRVRTISIQNPEAAIAQPAPASNDRHLRAMLFSDMVGYSALSETNVRAFPRHFLSMVRELLDAGSDNAEFCNTWGDGLFLGFKRWDDAARFALDLRERVATTNWESLGLPGHTDVRMGMHGGPIFKEWDPVLRRENYFGSHVVRAARIEPIAAPGAIWLTEEMACLLASMRTKGLTCEYLGQVPLAKGYGRSALYALERGNNWLNAAWQKNG